MPEKQPSKLHWGMAALGGRENFRSRPVICVLVLFGLIVGVRLTYEMDPTLWHLVAAHLFGDDFAMTDAGMAECDRVPTRFEKAKVLLEVTYLHDPGNAHEGEQLVEAVLIRHCEKEYLQLIQSDLSKPQFMSASTIKNLQFFADQVRKSSPGK